MNWLKGLIERLRIRLAVEKTSTADHLPQNRIDALQIPIVVTEACAHRPARGNVEVDVHGWRVFVPPSLACPDCLERWLNEASGVCATCQAPILPGDQVMFTALGYVHYRFGCYEGEVDSMPLTWGCGRPTKE
ncbi:MAG: hypothetical protein V1738_06985 [Patescibacteria group bacterium]